ncbi:MAG: hypothetical protein KatS3mg058_2657 [Roseiflexus sp.]|nr:hypothetical protein [Roseiflexus sp.]GIW01254.1 MAG: hypothetical protein KatS3mg058_2657 [Roseiflexus sp.]
MNTTSAPGARRPKTCLRARTKRERKAAEGEAIEYFDEDILPITSDHYLYLSGTPFRAIATGEFIEEQIYNWTYSDEQKAKAEWDDSKGPNPYAALPRMVLMTYQLPDAIREVAMQGEFNEFDLNVFFLGGGRGRQGAASPMKTRCRSGSISSGGHTCPRAWITSVWARRSRRCPTRMCGCRACSPTRCGFCPAWPPVTPCAISWPNRTTSSTTITRSSWPPAPQRASASNALPPVLEAMGDPLKTKTITLTCGKLTTGVTVRPWTGIFMLRNSI